MNIKEIRKITRTYSEVEFLNLLKIDATKYTITDIDKTSKFSVDGITVVLTVEQVERVEQLG